MTTDAVTEGEAIYNQMFEEVVERMYIPTYKTFGGNHRLPPFMVAPSTIKPATTAMAASQPAPTSPIPSAQKHDITSAAVQAERRRIREIDQVADVFPAELVQEAKYGKKTCSAKELAYRVAQAEGKPYIDPSPECFRARVEIRRLLGRGS